MLLVRLRAAEDREDGVADEFIDGAVVLEDDVAQHAEVVVEHVQHRA